MHIKCPKNVSKSALIDRFSAKTALLRDWTKNGSCKKTLYTGVCLAYNPSGCAFGFDPNAHPANIYRITYGASGWSPPVLFMEYWELGLNEFEEDGFTDTEIDALSVDMSDPFNPIIMLSTSEETLSKTHELWVHISPSIQGPLYDKRKKKLFVKKKLGLVGPADGIDGLCNDDPDTWEAPPQYELGDPSLGAEWQPDLDYLRMIANEGGIADSSQPQGQMFFAPSAAELQLVFDQVANALLVRLAS